MARRARDLYFEELPIPPLLTREGEIELARRRERAELEILAAIVDLGQPLGELLTEVDGPDDDDRSLAAALADARSTPDRRARQELLRGQLHRRRQIRRLIGAIAAHAAQAKGEQARALRTALSAIDAGSREAAAARDELVISNLRLVIRQAKRYADRGMPLIDLVQEGNLGLLRAADRYDYHLGFRFSTYAIWWIRQSVTRAIIDKGRTIRVPVHMADLQARIRRQRNALERETGRAAGPDEVSLRCGLDRRRVESALGVVADPVSLDARTSRDTDGVLLDLVPAADTPMSDDAIADIEITQRIRALLRTLGARECGMLRMRFGIGEKSDHTLEEIGRRYGVTRERVRQIEAKVLDRLRSSRECRDLFDLLGC